MKRPGWFLMRMPDAGFPPPADWQPCGGERPGRLPRQRRPPRLLRKHRSGGECPPSDRSWVISPLLGAGLYPSLRYVAVTHNPRVSEAWEEVFTGGSDAWEELFDALPDGWAVNKPLHDPERGTWQMYAFDQREGPKAKTRGWTAEAPTEDGVVREMARCLREISEGRAEGYPVQRISRPARIEEVAGSNRSSKRDPATRASRSGKERERCEEH